MTFYDFYSHHFGVMTTLFILAGLVAILLLTFAIVSIIKVLKTKNVKTPWFDIASESVHETESVDMARTRLLLSRQFDYIEKYVDGVQPIMLIITKGIVDDAIKVIFQNHKIDTTNIHLKTSYINLLTEEMILSLKIYLNGLLVVNHIGNDKDKIRKYAHGHVNQIMGMCRKGFSFAYTHLTKDVCINADKYWMAADIKDAESWVEEKLYDLLIGISELRYSDFGEELDNHKKDKKN